MAGTVRWEEMFKDEFEAAVAERPVCYFSYGLSEPHGVQNAMGLDGLKAYALVQLADEVEFREYEDQGQPQQEEGSRTRRITSRQHEDEQPEAEQEDGLEGYVEFDTPEDAPGSVP